MTEADPSSQLVPHPFARPRFALAIDWVERLDVFSSRAGFRLCAPRNLNRAVSTAGY